MSFPSLRHHLITWPHWPPEPRQDSTGFSSSIKATSSTPCGHRPAPLGLSDIQLQSSCHQPIVGPAGPSSMPLAQAQSTGTTGPSTSGYQASHPRLVFSRVLVKPWSTVVPMIGIVPIRQLLTPASSTCKQAFLLSIMPSMTMLQHKQLAPCFQLTRQSASGAAPNQRCRPPPSASCCA